VTDRLFIRSASNRRLKALRALMRGPRHDDAFVIFGYRQLRAAVDAGAVIREVFAAPELFLGTDDAALVARAEAAGATVYELDAATFRALSADTRPEGLAAVIPRWPTSLENLDGSRDPLYLVAESVERPGNLGTIVRNAAGAGGSGVVVAGGRTDPFHPEAVRAAIGTIFSIALAEAPTEAAIAWLRGRHVKIVAAAPDAASPYWAMTYRGATAIVVGSERHGVTRAWLEAADELARIPMPGPADSLNVGVAAGIFLFEAARQRLS
jgi:TrmH family RNA methyltransferase